MLVCIHIHGKIVLEVDILSAGRGQFIHRIIDRYGEDGTLIKWTNSDSSEIYCKQYKLYYSVENNKILNCLDRL